MVFIFLGQQAFPRALSKKVLVPVRVWPLINVIRCVNVNVYRHLRVAFEAAPWTMGFKWNYFVYPCHFRFPDWPCDHQSSEATSCYWSGVLYIIRSYL